MVLKVDHCNSFFRMQNTQMYFKYCIGVVLFSFNLSTAQTTMPAALLPQVSYGFGWSAGDLQQRFGQHNRLGGGLSWLNQQQKWQFGMNYDFIFGTQVKEDVLSDLRTPEGFIYGNDKSIAEIQLRQRGFSARLMGGRFWNWPTDRNIRGILVQTGVGLLQHKIRIQDDPRRAVPQLSKAYKKGYDQLSNGLSGIFFVGFQQLDRVKNINFRIGVETEVGWTQSRRSINFATLMPDTSNRLDIGLTVKFSWMIPILLDPADTIYY